MKILERRFRGHRFSVYDKQIEELRTVLVGIKSGKANAQLFPLRTLGKIETPAKGLFRIRLKDLDVKTAVFREIFPRVRESSPIIKQSPPFSPVDWRMALGLMFSGEA